MLSVSKVSAPSSTDSVTDTEEIELSLPAVLGRGSLLRCAETKVSRRHCTLDWDTDGVVIEAVHNNPTFVCIDGLTNELKKGQQRTIGDGDSFGMLSDAAWYKVALKLSKKNKLSSSVESKEDFKIVGEEAGKIISDNASSVKEDIENPEEIKKDDLKPSDAAIVCAIKESEALPGKCESVSKSPALHTTNQSTDVQCAINDEKTSNNGDSCTVKTTQIVSSGKVRTLPSWLSKIAKDGPKEDDSPKQVDKNTVKRSKATAKKSPSKPKNKPVAAKRKKANAPKYDSMSDSSPEEEVNTNTPCASPKKKSDTSPKSETSISPNKKLAKNLHGLSESDEESTPVKSKPNFFKGESENGNSSASPDKSKESANRKRRMSMSSSDDDDVPLMKRPATSAPEAGESSSTNTVSAEGTTNGSQKNPKALKQKRQSCRYGSGCFRKNPQHKKDEAHPGDSDYLSNDSEDENDSDDDRQECEFGVDCYRKNPQHRKDFKHTRYPQPQRRAKRKAKAKKNEDGDSEDSYDYDDPFFNDDSEDDFDPTDSGDSDSEWGQSQPLNEEEKKELKRAKKEANTFLGKKKRS